MFLSAVIVSFVLGAVVTLLVQLWFVQRWLVYQPMPDIPKKQQHPRFMLPKVLQRYVDSLRSQPGQGQGHSRGKQDEQALVLNMLMQFLFAELKDTSRVRRWTAKKLNFEFEEMLVTTTGKLIDQIQVRDFNFGSNFPVVKSVDLHNVEMKDDTIQTVDVSLDLDYSGGFQLTLDVDIIFGAWAYLSVTVTKLSGRARLQLTRQPFTHWSFAFFEEPKMEFEVDSRFNGRPIPQISSLIVNQIKRTIRKKHILPAYKMRYKPLFLKAEDTFLNPDICFRGNKLGRGKLTVKILKCSRLQRLSPDSKLMCKISVDKENMEEVWRQSWTTFDITIRLPSNSILGLDLKDQLSGEKAEKKRLIVDRIVPGTPASDVDLQRGDIIEKIGNIRVLSTKHAMKQIRLAGERVHMTIRRYQNRTPQDDIEQWTGNDFDQLDDDFEHIDITDNRPSAEPVIMKPIKESQTQKFTDKIKNRLPSTKKKFLGGVTVDSKTNNELIDVVYRRKSVNEGDSVSIRGDRAPSPAPAIVKDRSQSATSSPQKCVKDLQRQRAHSDTSLNRASDPECNSLPGELACCGTTGGDKRIEQETADIPFSVDPEWNEEFVFDCTDEDQYVNVCVWCKLAQGDRVNKQISTVKTDTPPTNDLPKYDVPSKIGYISVPLGDITASCLLTTQGDAQYTLNLHPPDESITASRSKLLYAGHSGFDKNLCHGDITLSFSHVPFKKLESRERKEVIQEILNPPQSVICPPIVEESPDGRHNFVQAQFPSGTYCHFCGKKIWLKGALHCMICHMVCHKKCVEKCQAQTHCTRDGPRVSGRLSDPWVAPVRGGDQDKDDIKTSGTGNIFKKLRNKDPQSLPLNIPNRLGQGTISPAVSPRSSPMRSPSPFGALGAAIGDGFKRTHSASSVGPLPDDDSDDDIIQRSHFPGYSLDDTVVIEAKEKGKELFADLSLPERKKTLDDMVTKLQDTIDKESEYKSELLRNHGDATDMDYKRVVSQQMDKCDEKMEALMMMMVHYCAGLQHCLDQEEAHKRLQIMKQEVDNDVPEDSGIQFVVTDTEADV